jgi:quinoprotein glucose dehydrogenase
MPIFRRLRLDLLTLAPVCLALGLVAAVSGSTRAPGHNVQVPAPPPIEPVRLDAPEVVQLESGDTARQAAAIREKAPVSVADGLEIRLWAAEPLLADPIALDVDGQGRVYVTQTTRRRSPDIDIRQHRDWMTPSLGFSSVEDRRAFLRRTLAPERSEVNTWLDDVNEDGSRDWGDLLVNRERLVRLEDTHGDGYADRSTVLIEDFHTEVTDVAGGLLVHGNDMYVAVSPDLWRLRDADGNGVLDTKQAIASGFHVHIGYGGHGMSGVTLGPDGRIYWSIGDVGMNVTDREGRRWAYPKQGVIVRSDPDGSNFEVFAAGLRNTHEFVFDEHGNLVSVDNDGDHQGETERIVYITEGQDSGWRINWQFGKYTDPDNNPYRVWMDEGMFRPRFEGQAAWFTPPVAAYDGGPAGMVYNPGTALSDRWRRHFFVADFTGSRTTSRVNAFRLTESGAGFVAGEPTRVLSGIVGTGMQFAPDGALYVADWVEGWGTNQQGRIWRLDVPGGPASPARVETAELLAAGFSDRSAADLRRLLAHDDMRVRQKAQFALVDRADVATLLAAAREDTGLARLHGLWGVAQLARADAGHAAALVPFLQAADAEVRAQAAKMIGDVRHGAAAGDLVRMLRDQAARPRFFAAEALGRLAHRPAVQPLIAMLEADDDRDVYLRHAGTLALARIGEVDPIAALAAHPSRALRIAAVVTLRRMRSPEVARFLRDADEFVVTEAARAINDDGGIERAMPALARVLDDPRFTNEALIRRAVNANLRIDTPEGGPGRLAAYARRADASEAMRIEAIDALGVWPRPSVLDRVDGWYHGQVERDAAVARTALEPAIEPLLDTGSPAVKVALLSAVGRLRIDTARPAVAARVRDDASPRVRMAALRALGAIGIAGAETAVSAALSDSAPEVRMTALELLPVLGLPADTAVVMLTAVLDEDATPERQRAVATLGQLGTAQADRALEGLVERLLAGTLPSEIQLDVLETARASTSARVRAGAERYDAGRPKENIVAGHRELLHGGDAVVGRRVTLGAVAQCSQCHSIEAEGAKVGPHLGGVGSRLTREELLEALMDPSARIAPGFGIVTLTLRSGDSVVGRLAEESNEVVSVETGEGQVSRVPAADITRRENAPSPMPPSQLFLRPREIRDVVEYLSSLR